MRYAELRCLSNFSFLRGVMMWVPALGETTFAQSGHIQATATGVKLELENAMVVLSPRGDDRVRHTSHYRGRELVSGV